MSDITFFFTLQLGVFISGVATVAFLFKFLFRLTEVEDRVSSSSACNVDRADIHSCESGAGW